MKVFAAFGVVAVAMALRLVLSRRRSGVQKAAPVTHLGVLPRLFGDIGLIASREVRERTKGKIFRIGTLVILLGVSAAIVIPVLHVSKPGVQRVGVIGPITASLRAEVLDTSTEIHAPVELIFETSRSLADQDLKSGRIVLAIVDARVIVVNRVFVSTDVSAAASLERSIATILALHAAYVGAQISNKQAAALAHARPTPIESLVTARNRGAGQATSVYGLILMFVLLQQYAAWTLMGVAEEKSSRVVEVLLAAVRPIQLLAGKVLGIGVVAFAQAAMIVGVALALGSAVGSSLLHGLAPLELLSALLWLLLGYAFYSWVFAAAGSLAERQDQLQSLSFPLSIPIILGYITSLIVAASGSTSALFDVLAYLPPTAPFAMTVLVGIGQATWWQFCISVALSMVSTFLVARVAAGIYRRAILRTRGRLRLSEIFNSSIS